MPRTSHERAMADTVMYPYMKCNPDVRSAYVYNDNRKTFRRIKYAGVHISEERREQLATELSAVYNGRVTVKNIRRQYPGHHHGTAIYFHKENV